ncbi:MAG TPA: hypothetical protein VI583_10690 [Cyclobacteriaceae bacterium]|nr:hypothetical protein [Cyclobacteriaceae bacterium]
MKKPILFLSVLLLAAACGQKQYFTSCPEIDLIKKTNNAYFSGDWQTLRSSFSDTAKIWNITWMGQEIGPDAYVEMLKSGVADLAEYKMSDDAIYEMVITDKGEHWVHNWLLWSGKHNNGKEFSTPVHISSMIKDGKIINNAIIFNELPGYLATMSSDTTITQ